MFKYYFNIFFSHFQSHTFQRPNTPGYRSAAISLEIPKAAENILKNYNFFLPTLDCQKKAQTRDLSFYKIDSKQAINLGENYHLRAKQLAYFICVPVVSGSEWFIYIVRGGVVVVVGSCRYSIPPTAQLRFNKQWVTQLSVCLSLDTATTSLV